MLEGFKYGFQLGEHSAYFEHNLLSVWGKEGLVQNKIDKEVAKRRVLHPFPTLPIENLRVSSLGIMPK